MKRLGSLKIILEMQKIFYNNISLVICSESGRLRIVGGMMLGWIYYKYDSSLISTSWKLSGKPRMSARSKD